MSRQLYVAKSPAIAARKLGSEMMIMCARNSTLFILDDIATLIWESADGSTTLHELVEDNICSTFEVRFDQALQDAEELAEALAKHGVILLAGVPIPSPNLFPGHTR